jgi:hypothetical protein
MKNRLNSNFPENFQIHLSILKSQKANESVFEFCKFVFFVILRTLVRKISYFKRRVKRRFFAYAQNDRAGYEENLEIFHRPQNNGVGFFETTSVILKPAKNFMPFFHFRL